MRNRVSRQAEITAKLAVIFLKNGGPNRDRTDDLTDAKSHLNIFHSISDYL